MLARSKGAVAGTRTSKPSSGFVPAGMAKRGKRSFTVCGCPAVAPETRSAIRMVAATRRDGRRIELPEDTMAGRNSRAKKAEEASLPTLRPRPALERPDHVAG